MSAGIDARARQQVVNSQTSTDHQSRLRLEPCEIAVAAQTPQATYALLQALFQIGAAGVGEPGAKYWEFAADLPIGRVDMRTSVKRYRTSPTHLVEYWSTNAGQPANATLRVFGRLKKTGEELWYLKPLAIADVG